MGKRNNRICVICGNEYHFCPSCGEDAGKPTWYFAFDSENCHDVYGICVAWRDNEISTAEAYKRVKALDLSNLENFADVTKNQIKEIIAYGEINSVSENKVDTVKNTNTNNDVTKNVQKTNTNKRVFNKNKK